MKNLIILFLMFCLFNNNKVLQAEETLKRSEKISNKMIKPTFLIQNPVANCSGTGFILRTHKVNDYYINIAMTCDHVLRSDAMTHFRFFIVDIQDGVYQGRTMSGNVNIIERNAEFDYAIFYFVTFVELPAVDVSFEKMRVGDDVFSVGCSHHNIPRLNKGMITYSDNLQEIIINNTYTIRGDSGGPLFNDKMEAIGFQCAISSTLSLDRKSEDALRNICQVNTMVGLKRRLEKNAYVLDKEKNIPILLRLKSSINIFNRN